MAKDNQKRTENVSIAKNTLQVRNSNLKRWSGIWRNLHHDLLGVVVIIQTDLGSMTSSNADALLAGSHVALQPPT